MKYYSWQRYWHDHKKDPTVNNGFLLVWGEHETVSFPFEHFSDQPCLVLLGEPGMGKSRELKRIYEQQIEDENNLNFILILTLFQIAHISTKYYLNLKN